jgi:hypothetical protein
MKEWIGGFNDCAQVALTCVDILRWDEAERAYAKLANSPIAIRLLDREGGRP